MEAKYQNLFCMVKKRSGFTLIEMLIVIIILGILAMVIVPQITVSTDDAKVSTAKQNLSTLRSAIGLYQAQHNNTYPNLSLNTNQLTMYSNADGTIGYVNSTSTPLGPYMKDGLPKNPFNDLSTVESNATATLNSGRYANASVGWVYFSNVGLVFPADALSSGGTAHINY